LQLETETLLINRLEGVPSGCFQKTTVFENEVRDVVIEFVSITGKYFFEEPPEEDVIDVLLTIDGAGVLEVNSISTIHRIVSSTIARIPYLSGYSIRTEGDEKLSFIRLRRLLDDKDVQVIDSRVENYNTLYIKALSDCPTYKEDIKSEKTLNRMILPEGLVPRLAMGSVETAGPDVVGAHEHPMLDQIFLGLKGCRCCCYADGEQTVLTENTMLHIPLGSEHHVSVADRDKLAYIWMDFFLSLEGEKYMGEQHQMEEDQT
jgi:quercetin dioxygenase-like cupin family protein